ncbi:MAG: GNAT family N-acetyltransferase [Myxococcota bacterium]
MAAAREVQIRAGGEADLPAIDVIYGHYVRETPITFDVEPATHVARRAWLDPFAQRGPHRLLVAETEGRVVGWVATHVFRAKAAYASSAEVSIYLSPEATGCGVGSRLYAGLFEALASEDLHRLYAGVTLPNPASIALHRKFGFGSIGVFREVGYKLGRYWDVEWFERAL